MIALERILFLLLGILAAFNLCAHLPGHLVHDVAWWTALPLALVLVAGEFSPVDEDDL